MSGPTGGTGARSGGAKTDHEAYLAGETLRRARGALQPAASREALVRSARREARMARGRQHFVWQGRVLPIGVPVGLAVGAAVWHRERRRPARAWSAAVGAAVLTIAASWAGAELEWQLFANAYRREAGVELDL